MRALLVLALLTPALAGCFGGDDDALDPSATDGAGEVPTLPAGLEMEGAEKVSYTETTVTWRWTGTAQAGAWVPGLGAMMAARATFDVPSGMSFAVEGTLTWPVADTRGLGLEIVDPEGGLVCGDAPPNPFARQHAYCAALHPAPAEGSRSRVEVLTYLAEQPIRFELILRLTVGPPEFQPLSTAPARDETEKTMGSPEVHTVIGFADTGINPYHEAFRDLSPEARRHPSTYIDGYPEDAQALELTLDAPTYAEALGADAEQWVSIEPERLYWIPGTKIIGAIIPDAGELEKWPQYLCIPMLDCYGHGTGVAGRTLAEDRSLCPDCKMVAAQGFQSGLEWFAVQDWVDLSVIEFCDYPVRGDRVGDRAEDDALIARKPTFLPAGNGVEGSSVLGMPLTYCHHQGLPNTVSVGGYNDGRVVAWSNSMPHVAADLCMDVAHHQTKDSYFYGCGTSYAAPYAAGAGGQILLEARRILGDTIGGVHGDVLAKGATGVVDEGPLSNGEFTIRELKRVLFTTADPRPPADEHGGPDCDPVTDHLGCAIWQTLPIEWESVPEGVPQYYFMGYGGITPDTLEHAKRVLRGEEPMPERFVEDAFFALDQEVRKTLVEVDP